MATSRAERGAAICSGDFLSFRRRRSSATISSTVISSRRFGLPSPREDAVALVSIGGGPGGFAAAQRLSTFRIGLKENGGFLQAMASSRARRIQSSGYMPW